MNKKLAYLILIAALSCHIVSPAHAVETDAQLILKARQALRYADEEIALDILKPLAEKGNSEAMMMLATTLAHPKNQTLRDEVLANRIFERAFNNHYPPAIAEKARRYLYGDAISGVDRDAVKGITLFEEASSRGHASSSIRLAGLFSDEKYIPVDNSKAFTYAMLAFEQMSGSEVYTLAKFYREGIGTEPDLVRSYGLYSISCHSFLSSSCDEAEKIAVKLDKEQKNAVKLYIEDALKKRTDLRVIPLLEFDPALANATRANLLREYKLNSPFFLMAQYSNKEKYSATNRQALAYVLLLSQPLSMPSDQRNVANKTWKKRFQKVLSQLTNMDRERLQAMVKLFDDSESLLKKIDKELSNDELKYLVALYRSEKSKNIRNAFELIRDLEEDGNTRVWEKLANSGKDINGMNTIARSYFTEYENTVPEHKRELDRECNLHFLELRDQVSVSRDYLSKGASAGFLELAQLHIMMAKQRKEWITFCVGDGYAQLNQVLNWKPVQHERDIIYAWKAESMEMAQVKEINAHFDEAMQQILKGNK
ncbi:hypothetical protein [Undibacterium sp. TC9W]|uniref:tetratricopeptide repeat protein n=1 Tax=Undibacterium sp. TC9W TaxID=3413053 RepID=UPI003BF51993